MRYAKASRRRHCPGPDGSERFVLVRSAAPHEQDMTWKTLEQWQSRAGLDSSPCQTLGFRRSLRCPSMHTHLTYALTRIPNEYIRVGDRFYGRQYYEFTRQIAACRSVSQRDRLASKSRNAAGETATQSQELRVVGCAVTRASGHRGSRPTRASWFAFLKVSRPVVRAPIWIAHRMRQLMFNEVRAETQNLIQNRSRG